MRIILEGPDNAGKTTLAHAILKGMSQITYFHPGGKPADYLAELDCIEEQLDVLRENRKLIIDRVTPISQTVYNPSAEHDADRFASLAAYHEYKPVIIYCRPSTDTLLRTDTYTWREGESEEHKKKIIDGAHTFVQRYDAIMQRVPHIAYDYTDPTGQVILTKARQAMAGDQEAYHWFTQVINIRGF